MFDKKLGERLKYTRKNAGKTQEQVAKFLGVTRGAYSHLENNRNEPDNETLIKLADYFGVSTDYLLGNDNSSITTNDKVMTVAAHIDEDTSDEEMEEILDYIAYIKSKHKKK